MHFVVENKRLYKNTEHSFPLIISQIKANEKNNHELHFLYIL